MGGMYNELALHAEHDERRRRLTNDLEARRVRSVPSAPSTFSLTPSTALARVRTGVATEARRARLLFRRHGVVRA